MSLLRRIAAILVTGGPLALWGVGLGVGVVAAIGVVATAPSLASRRPGEEH